MSHRNWWRAGCLHRNKGKTVLLLVCMLLIVAVGVTHWRTRLTSSGVRVEIYPSWTTRDPHDQEVVQRVYLYSAFLTQPPHTSNHRDIRHSHIHLTVFLDNCLNFKLTCCLKLGQNRQNEIFESAGKVDFSRSSLKTQFSLSSNENKTCVAVYACDFPVSPQRLDSAYITLTNESCPLQERSYLPVQRPEFKAGGLAVCAKAIYGQELDPRKLVQWFEMQRLLGVDKVQLFDLGNSEIVNRILRHYQDIGFLNLLPLSLPGRLWGRVLKPLKIDFEADFFPVVDCRLRLAGYDYIMGIDVDEVILPRKHHLLKPFIAEQFKKDSMAASLFFNVQFFVEEWGPVNAKAPLTMLQYLNSTAPRWECYKYIYQPSRAHQVTTHVVHSYPGYSRRIVPSEEGVIFHYRKCPQGWKSCNPPRITDISIVKYEDHLVPSVSAVFRKVGL